MAVTCRNVRHLYDAYVDGELSPSLTAEVQAHVLQCPECQRELELLRAAGRVIAADVPAPALPRDFAARVVCALPTRAPAGRGRVLLTRRERRRLLWRRVHAGLVPAAAAVLAVAALLPPIAPPSAAPSAPRVVAGEAEYGPVEVLGVRSLVDPTLSTLSTTERFAGNLQGLYRITVDQAGREVPAAPAPESPRPVASGGAFMAELLHPFANMLTPAAPPPPKPQPDDDVVRF